MEDFTIIEVTSRDQPLPIPEYMGRTPIVTGVETAIRELKAEIKETKKIISELQKEIKEIKKVLES